MNFPRASGILLHPTSLPSRFGIGDFGDEAYKFIDFLQQAGQTYWQILPLGPTGYGDSPYSSFSAFAGNTLLVAPQKIVEDGFLTEEETIERPYFSVERVDFGSVIEWKNNLLKLAFQRFRQTTDEAVADSFHKFCDANNFWLEDYALYRAIKKQNQDSWQNWDAPLKLRQPEALSKAKQELDEEMFAQKFYQYLFYKQWFDLKRYANERGVKIVGDVPIFVAFDSCDVWCNPSQFKLNEDGSPRVVSGVPPDYFSNTGQLWGNPIYNWEEMQADGFRWWIDRMRFIFQTVDVVRVDHFRGFEACWEVPGTDRTAETGRWVHAPGDELFAALRNALGDLPMLAEDLGVITPEVERLRDSIGLPGMRILLFAFGGDSHSNYLPHNYIKNSVVYTGNHDNDTVVGWFKSTNKRERDFCLKYLKSNKREINWDFIRAAFSSVADTAIVPLQDVLGLGNEARMNLPSSYSGNWNWRCKQSDFTEEISQKLKEMTEIFQRQK
ncbi:MAG: 4-alpha-glucanotransferase [Acidobacteriota bacterium]|nr:4-alpha-glucanotransferase [Acidobacteriota bacterium]